MLVFFSQINQLAIWLASEMDKITYDSLYEEGPILEKYEELRKKYSLPDKPFLFQVRIQSIIRGAPIFSLPRA